MKHPYQSKPSTHEKGFSLITSLVLLVIASLLGVAASQLVLMSERSSRYDRDRLLAFQAAEAALLDAERDIRGPGSVRAALFSPLSITGFEDGCSTSSATRGMCLPAGPGEKPVWATVSFTDTDRTVEFGDYTNRKYAAGSNGVQPARAPRYLIEVIEDHLPGGNAGASRHLYRVSAVGFGPREETQVMLQMFFRKEYPSYLESVRKGRRAEARAALANLMQQQERHLTQNNIFVVFPAGATGTPFRTHSASSGHLSDSSHLLGARACAAVGGTLPGARDCIEVFAEPRVAGMADLAAADIAVDSLGRRSCNGSTSSLKPCWP